MILCLDIGNTHIYGGVFSGEEIQLRFRYPSKQPCTSDQLGLFLKNVLRENGVDLNEIEAICLSSVVPSIDYSVRSACIKYFDITPLELKPGSKTGIKLDVKQPQEVGADRIANAVAAVEHFPNKNLLIIDFGTATTICAISKDKAFIGGAILPGLQVSINALSQNASKLPAVDILKPEHPLGKTTETNIQAGLYYGQLGAIKELISQYKGTTFQNDDPICIATGGYAYLFEEEGIYSANIPDLVLHGIRLVWEKNR